MIESSAPGPKGPAPPCPERRPGWKTAVLYVLRVFIVVGSVVIFAAVVVRLHPPVFVWGLAAAGRSPMCSVGDLMVGANTRYRLGETAQELGSRCQKVEQDEAGFDLWETPLGAFWIPAGNWWPLHVLVAQQLVEDYGNRDQGVQQGDIVLDCGAHVGVYTRKALQSEAAVVVAIEPSPKNIECLRRNFRKEIAQGRVVIYPKGVWDKDDVLPFFELSQNTAASNFVVGSAAHVVNPGLPLTTIDKLVTELGLPRVDLIKMDIKGATMRALHGAKTTLDANKPRLVIAAEEDEDDPLEIAAFAEGLGIGYRTECGRCSMTSNYQVVPEVLFFR